MMSSLKGGGAWGLDVRHPHPADDVILKEGGAYREGVGVKVRMHLIVILVMMSSLEGGGANGQEALRPHPGDDVIPERGRGLQGGAGLQDRMQFVLIMVMTSSLRGVGLRRRGRTNGRDELRPHPGDDVIPERGGAKEEGEGLRDRIHIVLILVMTSSHGVGLRRREQC